MREIKPSSVERNSVLFDEAATRFAEKNEGKSREEHHSSTIEVPTRFSEVTIKPSEVKSQPMFTVHFLTTLLSREGTTFSS
mmetsp:Transcript_30916/g.118501  ORF Transcript_30916/g.118501 Transcript_30916/m.118501 type:complete len:81 (+) Transcript_30916:2035-2277(+)